MSQVVDQFEVVSCHVEGSKADVTIRCVKGVPITQQIDLLSSSAARNFVLAEAAKKGIQGVPGISSATNIVPYNDKGVSLDEVWTDHVAKNGTAPIDSKLMQNDHYAVSFKVLGKQ